MYFIVLKKIGAGAGLSTRNGSDLSVDLRDIPRLIAHHFPIKLTSHKRSFIVAAQPPAHTPRWSNVRFYGGKRLFPKIMDFLVAKPVCPLPRQPLNTRHRAALSSVIEQEAHLGLPACYSVEHLRQRFPDFHGSFFSEAIPPIHSRRERYP